MRQGLRRLAWGQAAKSGGRSEEDDHATPQPQEPVSGSCSALVEDARLLQQALEIAGEDPEAFERTTGLAGLGIASRLVPAPDDATLDHDR